ncbi:MAG TPA: hypothetical protein VFV15_06220 [Moraxellaceae bacterium]|nr:hypothetical protein [Moraxellaceae bacterium]
MKAWKGLLLVLAALSLGACMERQHKPETYGEAMQQRGEVNKAVGDKWQRGNAKVERGTRMMADAQKDQEEGQRLIREGREEMRAAEEEGRMLRGQPLSTEPTAPTSPAPAPAPAQY